MSGALVGVGGVGYWKMDIQNVYMRQRTTCNIVL